MATDVKDGFLFVVLSFVSSSTREQMLFVLFADFTSVDLLFRRFPFSDKKRFRFIYGLNEQTMESAISDENTWSGVGGAR